MKFIRALQSPRQLATFAVAGLLQFSTMPALAQGVPLAGPPPAPPTPRVSVSEEKTVPPMDAPVSLSGALAAESGKTPESGVIRKLRFAGVDANSDGVISRSEFSVFMNAGRENRSDVPFGADPSAGLFRHIDRNGDDVLSEEEVTTFQKEEDAKR